MSEKEDKAFRAEATLNDLPLARCVVALALEALSVRKQRRIDALLSSEQ